jgi:hypothetical protein
VHGDNFLGLEQTASQGCFARAHGVEVPDRKERQVGVV